MRTTKAVSKTAAARLRSNSEETVWTDYAEQIPYAPVRNRVMLMTVTGQLVVTLAFLVSWS